MNGVDSVLASKSSRPDNLNASEPAVQTPAAAGQKRKVRAATEDLTLRSTKGQALSTDDSTDLAPRKRRRLDPVLTEPITQTEALQTPFSQPNNVPDSEQPSPNPRPGADETAVKAPDPNDWVAQSAAMQRSLAELGQKAALDTALLKLQNDLNDATVSVMKSMGSSVKSAAQ